MALKRFFTLGRVVLYGLLVVLALFVGRLAIALEGRTRLSGAAVVEAGLPQIATRATPTIVQYAGSTPMRRSARLIGQAGGTLRAGHFVLTVPPSALTSPVAIKLVETSPLLVRCAIQPAGLRFARPATLTISYAGTSAEPSAPNYAAGGRLTALSYNESIDTWTSVGGADDRAARAFSIPVGRLSECALAK